MENSSIPFAVYQFIDKRVVTVAISAGFCKQFGFENLKEAYELMDKNMYRDTHPDDVTVIADAALQFATEGGEYDVLYRTKVDGHYNIIHAKGKHIYKENNVRLAVIWYFNEGVYLPDAWKNGKETLHPLRMLLETRTLNNKINYDYLTGLPSLSYFLELAEAGRQNLMDRNEDTAMLFMDLNGMEGFNRKYGMAEGDNLLIAFSRILVRYFSNENCCRLGADHFVVYTAAEGLNDLLKNFFADCGSINEGNSLPVRVGIYLDSMEQVSAGTACDRAKMACDFDRRIYVSRYYYFKGTMLQQAEKRQYIIDNIDRAIRDGWIKVFYQPIVRAANGRVCNEEALVRWIDPEKGILLPEEFIPILEDAKLVYKIDLFVTEQILLKFKEQKEEGLYIVPVSVNLSRSDFNTCDIVEEIRRRVDDAGIRRDKLTIEVTERVINRDPDYMKEQIGHFHNLGFSVWIDDFGSGSSSPELLQQMPFDVVKLDVLYMQKFESSEKSRIILTELIKMAVALNLDTVAEGVETEEQADFLKEIGCTMLQGFRYCKPIPSIEIINRNRKGIQIGFENPKESAYYMALGRVNLYDLSLSMDHDGTLNNYFNTLPMVILETGETELKIVRSNKPFREFLKRHFPGMYKKNSISYHHLKEGAETTFAETIKRCAADGNKVVLDIRTYNEESIHFLIRRVAVNPVTGVAALSAVILSFAGKNEKNNRLDFTYVARALSSDYISLYYVNLDTENFIEYSPDGTTENLNIERHGENFFAKSREDALSYLHKADQESFIERFTKENVIQDLTEHGTFTATYRLLMDGEPVYVNMKAVRILSKKNHIIIGVSNVDAQMKQRALMERIKEERAAYSRIIALSGDYICIYTVDPATGRYIEYNVSESYNRLGLTKEGDDFFTVSQKESQRVIYPEDLNRFTSMFTEENVMHSIRKNGFFLLHYRLVMDEKPVYVSLKAVIINEYDEPQMIVGISNIDAQVRREQTYAHNLSIAQDKANNDALTGVKNKYAYVTEEERLNRMLENGQKVRFAIAVCDINGLKQINDTLGHQAGDRFIIRGCRLICSIFSHSPVFRIGGDEFAIILQDKDYDQMDDLMTILQRKNTENQKKGDVVIAAGMERYNGESSVSDVFKKADEQMYQNKKILKSREQP